MTRFEYRLLTVRIGAHDEHDRVEAELDALGAEGWEAVGFSPATASGRGLHVETTEYVVLFKRASTRGGRTSETR
jgi:hypothetical protein